MAQSVSAIFSTHSATYHFVTLCVCVLCSLYEIVQPICHEHKRQQDRKLLLFLLVCVGLETQIQQTKTSETTSWASGCKISIPGQHPKKVLSPDDGYDVIVRTQVYHLIP